MKAKLLPSGNYRVQVISGYDEKGKRIVRSFTAGTEWEALKMADDYKKGLIEPLSRLTVYDAISQYIDVRSNILSPATLKGYVTIRDTRLQSIMHKKIGKIKTYDIQQAVNLDSERLCRKSIKDALALLKSALAMQDVDINIKKIALPPAKRIKKDIPTAEQVLRIIIGSDLELPCLLAMWLSLRISEVRGLQFRDISPDGKYISIRRTKLYLTNGDVVRNTTKTLESTRTNRLPPYLLGLIRNIPHEKETDFIVPLGYNCIRKRFKALVTKHGYDMTFHTLRHEFATTLNDLGIPSDYIQKLGGWSTDNVMKSVYTHTIADREDQYQDIIDGYFNGLISGISADQ